MPKMKRRVAGWGVVAPGLVLTLVVAWTFAAPKGSTEVAPVTPAPLVKFVPAPIVETGEARDRAIFSEIRRAQHLAMIEARRTAQQYGGGGMPMSPSARKHESLSVTLAAESAASALKQIALAYGVSVGELKALYLRGDAAGWEASDANTR